MGEIIWVMGRGNAKHPGGVAWAARRLFFFHDFDFMGSKQCIQVITDGGLGEIQLLANLGGIGAALARNCLNNLMSSIELHESIVAYSGNSAKEILRY